MNIQKLYTELPCFPELTIYEFILPHKKTATMTWNFQTASRSGRRLAHTPQCAVMLSYNVDRLRRLHPFLTHSIFSLRLAHKPLLNQKDLHCHIYIHIEGQNCNIRTEEGQTKARNNCCDPAQSDCQDGKTQHGWLACSKCLINSSCWPLLYTKQLLSVMWQWVLGRVIWWTASCKGSVLWMLSSSGHKPNSKMEIKTAEDARETEREDWWSRCGLT